MSQSEFRFMPESCIAAQALMTGTVLIEGDGFPSALVDFGRDPTLTVALSGSST
jgi:hypothetical protein